MRIENNQLVIEYGMELLSLQDMLEDLPYYLNLQNVNLSAISESQRTEMLNKIKVILNNLNGDNKKCEKCNKQSNILQGDYGELLCPKCYKEVIEMEKTK